MSVTSSSYSSVEEKSNKDLALNMIAQIQEMERERDAEYLRLLAEKHIYRHGQSAISFHLQTLEELIKEL